MCWLVVGGGVLLSTTSPWLSWWRSFKPPFLGQHICRILLSSHGCKFLAPRLHSRSLLLHFASPCQLRERDRSTTGAQTSSPSVGAAGCVRALLPKEHRPNINIACVEWAPVRIAEMTFQAFPVCLALLLYPPADSLACRHGKIQFGQYKAVIRDLREHKVQQVIYSSRAMYQLLQARIYAYRS